MRKMTAKEFQSGGYLQEVNRRFLHPLGLALEVIVEADGRVEFGAVQDHRDDPEGMIFSDGMINRENAHRIDGEIDAKLIARIDALGFHVQPIPEISS